MSNVIIQGAKHSYNLTPAPPVDSPPAPTIAFLHGWMLSQAYWKPLIDRLQLDFQCLSYDLRGFGLSEIGDRDEYSLISYARDLEELLDRLEISQVWLVGHSLGGAIALWAASLLSDRILGVVCLNAGGGIYIKEEFEKFRSAGKIILKLRPRWLQNLPPIHAQFAKDSVQSPLDLFWGKQRTIDFVSAKYAAAKGTLLDSTSEEEVHKLPQIVSKLSQPIYFIAGANDNIMEPKYVRHLASFHPSFNGYGENVFELPNCGHMAMLEQTNLLHRLLLDLLAKPVASSCI
ncbi:MULTISPECIES: alpha/beta fold hydrolase [Pseudanabaena]|uniref:Alpha/beta hydrolase fold protein n=2 Tax=Pseudanabaena TaxID=1152 RepID=L8N0E3_9CYAN|nr:MULTISPECIES: alpha/beta hydrolase [Pseudanabaena]ELS33191.1 alpha/beta hydrolase fold protein [Pseudanabaena biceps PCC 7429]MDG3494575.1 alpha/beta hydrolase [Pseudanabaena catenata USMAC16]